MHRGGDGSLLLLAPLGAVGVRHIRGEQAVPAAVVLEADLIEILDGVRFSVVAALHRHFQQIAIGRVRCRSDLPATIIPVLLHAVHKKPVFVAAGAPRGALRQDVLKDDLAALVCRGHQRDAVQKRLVLDFGIVHGGVPREVGLPLAVDGHGLFKGAVAAVDIPRRSGGALCLHNTPAAFLSMPRGPGAALSPTAPSAR